MSARTRTVFIAGATGVLGARLVRALADRGHRVIGLARSDAKAELVRSCGGEPAAADVFDPDALAVAALGADVFIHAATAIPTGKAALTRLSWALNDRLRTEGTRALTTAAAAVGARRFLQQSVAWVVEAEPGGPCFDESTPPSPPALLESAVRGEEIVREAGVRGGFQATVLRNGVFYAPDAAHTREMAENLRRRRATVIGKGDALVAPIHVDDAAHAFVLAVETERAGLWNVVDDEPVPSATYLAYFAELLGAPSPRRLPRWVARLVAGKEAVDAMTTSMNTTNARIRRELGWAPRYPTYRDGLAAVVEAWAAAGVPSA